MKRTWARATTWGLGCACAALSLDFGIACGLGWWSVLAGLGAFGAGTLIGVFVVSLIEGRHRRIALWCMLTGCLLGSLVWLVDHQLKTRKERSAGTLTVNTVSWFHNVLGCAIRDYRVPDEIRKEIYHIVLYSLALRSVSSEGGWYSAEDVLESGPGDKTGPYLEWAYAEAPYNMQWGPILLRVRLYPGKTDGLSSDSLVWRGCTVDLVRPGSYAYPGDTPTEHARLRKKTEALMQAVKRVVKETSVARSPDEQSARKRHPLVTGLVEFPDGTRTNRILSVCVLEETAVGQGSMSGTLTGAVGAPGPIELDTYSFPFQNVVWRRVLSFSNLVSAPVTITFTNGMPDRTNFVFKMRKVM